jgi:hypothetical protein
MCYGFTGAEHTQSEAAMKAAWVTFRLLRLGLWLAAVVYYFRFFLNRGDYLTPFGHLLTSTELWMFGLPLAALFAGFFELMMRERAGIPRPALGRNWVG